MGNKIFVGNLPWSVNDDKLREMFAEFGDITEATVITNKFTGRSKGFGFVEFGSDDSANKAVEAMNEKELEGRNISVSIARPREESEGSDRRDNSEGGDDAPAEASEEKAE